MEKGGSAGSRKHPSIERPRAFSGEADSVSLAENAVKTYSYITFMFPRNLEVH